MGFFMSTKIGGILAFALVLRDGYEICTVASCLYYTHRPWILGVYTWVLLLFLSLTASGDSEDVKCENIYKDFSDCVLELGESMDNYQENVTSERGVAAVCSHWEAFHTCALTALSDCQEEVSSIWETLRQDSRKMRFQGSLFDLCSPSSAPNINSRLTALTLPLMLVMTGPNWSSV